MLTREDFANFYRHVVALGPRRLAALAAAGVAVVVAVTVSSFYFSRPEFEVLYIGLNQQDVSRMGQVLKDSGVAFDAAADGSKMLVARGQSAKARMILAERGLPASGTAGYELFEKLGPLGLTSFMQEVTRVRALEGEIARSIQTIRGVTAARVHIVLSDPGSLRRAKQVGSASVIIKTEGSKEFAGGDAIRHLVSAAVPGLPLENVKVLGTDGRVLAGGNDGLVATSQRMIDIEKSISREIEANIRRALLPHVGIGNFEATVAVKLNVDKHQINETKFDPNSKVERSIRTVKESNNSQGPAAKSSVTVEQNIPNEQGQSQSADMTRKNGDRREQLSNFEVSSRSVSTISDGYKIEAISIAVVVNDKILAAPAGTAGAGTEKDQSKIKDIEKLVAAAAGVDTKRGDQLAVMAVEFRPPSLDSPTTTSFMETLSAYSGTAFNAIALIAAALIVVFLGLNPAVNRILNWSAPAGEISVPQLEGMPAEGPGAMATAFPASMGGADIPGLNSPRQRLEQLFDQQQEQSIAVLQEWLRNR